ncbi:MULTISPECIES: MaoC family dehydratase [Kocuria]|jgi:acyl dehydratase|uniref:Enoyl-CoA hydratase n=1 Tax=Kocuria rosea subsp. polaris TaxID=136273 RepID=A0A0A6VTV5_KOCRO|nr:MULTISPECIES: MaoC family dehydratase [Kocuria]EYT55551.1 enoyl-CoA hydratase [Kocuria sp. UCD-OTCP]KHD98315.1 enoyl-CoA hydratase [Kocuria polaris]MCM3486706.1 MaoC family dehydratase [Kocuria rosea]MEB2525948.1 MaoC family dehydratase [Kocuria rosea]MEB2618611.1 MaoC family dehydratase [Kocuria rosea]
MTEAQTQPQTVVAFDEVKNLVGKSLGHSAWREITQEQVNTFADATDDHQWIHVDPERAAEGPFGAPIAHGFLTLSLLIPMWSELFDVTGVKTKVNYGLDKVRFTSPVKVGSRIRMTVTITDVQEVKGNGLHLVADGTIEIEGEERPAVVATFLNRFYA